MQGTDYSRLIAELSEEYTRRSPKSAALHGQAKQHLVDGGNHSLRLIQPFPPRIVAAQGGWATDEDGHRLLELWQGHYANLLGHNPEVVTDALARSLARRWGLQTGLTDRLQVELAELVCRLTATERVRFTTSGTLATMYAILLARAFTGRELVLKVGGGWHGAHPWALKGVDLVYDGKGDAVRVESSGLPAAVTGEVVVSGFNDLQLLHEHFHQFGDQLACFIVEPFIGAGGFIMASREYLQAARELTQKHGALLILDEVISGFRFRAGPLGPLLGVHADLMTLGKVMGGGMPVAAVAGRADVMALAAMGSRTPVRFSGGTYSAHPSSMLAAQTFLAYLAEHEVEVYPRLAKLGALTRQTVEAAFAEEGIFARCTGASVVGVPGSSLYRLNFPHRPDQSLSRPEEVFDPAVCDVALSDRVLQLALLLEDVHLLRGRVALSTTHTEKDIEFLGEACRRVARRVEACR